MESNRGDERCGRHTQRAHHMRRGQQPGMHRTPHTTHDTHSNPRQQAHTHSPAATPTHRWKREKQTGAAHKAPPHAHTARAVRRVRSPHGGYAHTHEKVQRSQQHKSKVTIKKKRSPHTTWIVGPRELQPTFITTTIQLPSAFVHIQRTPLHAGLGTTAAAAHATLSAKEKRWCGRLRCRCHCRQDSSCHLLWRLWLALLWIPQSERPYHICWLMQLHHRNSFRVVWRLQWRVGSDDWWPERLLCQCQTAWP
ncbi:hypothetical protein ECC02_008708 [Trypanosoma cruzi]|uniref:Uncharacterized protein n=1 Tax=Trypanosoma cruzi TaxID=5693 RepID=A0A7J6XVA3_TRYCR|nr:hypothetical protein ECC02_008708 [Trypanosoma cruzi]